jgi:hypothetical protein
MSNKYYSPDGNLEVWDTKPEGYFTEEEWAELHPAPPAPEPTKEEKLVALDAQYNADKAELVAQYTDSLMHDDEETAEAIKAEMAELDAQYDADYEAIINEDTEEE